MNSRGKQIVQMALDKISNSKEQHDTLLPNNTLPAFRDDFQGDSNLDDSDRDPDWVPEKRKKRKRCHTSLGLDSSETSESDENTRQYIRKARKKKSRKQTIAKSTNTLINRKKQQTGCDKSARNTTDVPIATTNMSSTIVETDQEHVNEDTSNADQPSYSKEPETVSHVPAVELQTIAVTEHAFQTLNSDVTDNVDDKPQDETIETTNKISEPDSVPINKDCSNNDQPASSNEQETETDSPVQELETMVFNSQVNDNYDHEEVIQLEEAIEPPVVTKKKARNRAANPTTWERNINKNLRMTGKSYNGRGKSDSGKVEFCVEKHDRILCPRECTKRCDNKRNTRSCSMISDDVRQKTFDEFWNNMDWKGKKVYAVSLVEKCKPDITSKDASRRHYTYKYHLKNGSVKLPVCKSLYLSTLGIGEYTIQSWMNNASPDTGIPNTETTRGPQLRQESAASTYARKYLTELPKMESHYCRANTTKQYLEPVFDSFSHLHRVYEEDCKTNEQPTVARPTLLRLFQDMNLSIFSPKKDQCDLCCGYETKNVTEEVYNMHIERKNKAREEKLKDKEMAEDNNSVKVITMDLQSVLLCPSIKASAIYYKTKLACHDFTIYDLTTKAVSCYFWHEGEGGLSASMFATCLDDYLRNIDEPELKEVIIYSDGCGYQNRNVVMSNTLLRYAVQEDVIVTQKILEKGHTQMEVDSTHSTIERKIRNHPIYTPNNYVDLIKEARPGDPYHVEYVSSDFFKDFTSLNYYDSIRPGSKVGDPVVTDLRVLRYLPSGKIVYKCKYGDEFADLPRRARVRVPQNDDTVGAAYTGPLEIKSSKYTHLQQLKSVIPKDYHKFYDDLLH